MGIWLLIVLLDNQSETILVQILVYKNGIIKRILREDKKKGPRRNSRLLKNHLFPSRPEVVRKTFSRYKISKSQTLETLVLLEPHLIVTFPLSILFLLLFARKANLVCLLFIVSQTCFNKKRFFVVVKQRVFSILWVAKQSRHLYYLTVRRRSGWTVSTPSMDLSTQRGHGRIWQSQQPEANVVVTNTIATTSTVTSSHKTLGSVTSIIPRMYNERNSLNLRY